jgi:hypothetical protein
VGAHPGRLAQRESASFTPKRSLVRSQYRPPSSGPNSDLAGHLSCPRTAEKYSSRSAIQSVSELLKRFASGMRGDPGAARCARRARPRRRFTPLGSARLCGRFKRRPCSHRPALASVRTPRSGCRRRRNSNLPGTSVGCSGMALPREWATTHSSARWPTPRTPGRAGWHLHRLAPGCLLLRREPHRCLLTEPSVDDPTSCTRDGSKMEVPRCQPSANHRVYSGEENERVSRHPSGVRRPLDVGPPP